MPFLDFGLSQGLAYKYNANADMDAERDLYEKRRQARIDAENKAKLLGDMFKFGKAYDKYNEGRLNNFITQRMTEIGRFVDENPDFQTNPGKWMSFQNMTRELLDNPIVSESMRFKTQMDYLNDYQAKTPGSADFEDVKRMKQEVGNYLETGSTDGNAANRREFTFSNPDDLIDWKNEVAMMFKQSEMHGLSKGPHGSSTIYSTDADLEGVTEATKSKPWFYLVRKEYEGLTPEMKAKYPTIEKYIRYFGQPFAPTTKFDEGWKPDAPGGPGSGFDTEVGAYDTWDNLHMAANKFAEENGTAARFAMSPEATATVFGTKDPDGKNVYNLTPGSVIVGRNGEVFGDRKIVLNGSYKATPAGYIRSEPGTKGEDGKPINAKYYQGYVMEVPLADAYSILGEDNSDGIFNEMNAFEYDTEDLKTGDIEVRDRYKPFFEITDHDGKPFVKINVEQPYNPHTVGFSEAYNKIYNPNANKAVVGTSERKYPEAERQKMQEMAVNARRLIYGKRDDETVQWFDGSARKVSAIKAILAKMKL